MVLVIDNYDSFTYNLVQYLGEITSNIVVRRNDAISAAEIAQMKPSHILLSPGPGRPEAAGICVECIKIFYRQIPILGVCLGHQAIGHAFGAKIIRAPEIFHGKASDIYHSKKRLFRKIPSPFSAIRYHSLVIDSMIKLPDFSLEAKTQNGIIMAIAHKKFPLYGVQFHPESFLTMHGKQLLANFISEHK
ncbi:MAG: aminodeoxychorismate/anthranilate synthase component II [Spirochaetes bacterium GWF1_41_5]|nr:MAG: aminodeoxychorismate/anthranilate synthase component II [Spirochaetes bacterium GWF1_41_5]